MTMTLIASLVLKLLSLFALLGNFCLTLCIIFLHSGNHFAVLCNRFREISLSRALALSTCIRGNSIVDVEAHFAFPSGFEQNLMPQGDHIFLSDAILNFFIAI